MLPRISIVTPNFNQARFLEETLRSVLDAGYPNLEYIVIDGGSTDGSVDVIRRYADRLAYWISEPDEGAYDAINKGFERSTGEIMGWLNSDDLFVPWALRTVGIIMRDVPQCEWLTTLNKVVFDEGGDVRLNRMRGYSRRSFLEGRHVFGVQDSWGGVQQESTFWRRTLWARAGGRLDTAFGLAADFELWMRFYEHAELMATVSPLGGPRVHAAQRHVLGAAQYMQECQRILERGRSRMGWRPGRSARMGLNRIPGVRQAVRRRYAYTGYRIDKRFGENAAWFVESYDFH